MLHVFQNPASRAGVILGLGLGGFLDGIVLHQILGWHHLVCTTETCRPDSIEALQTQNTQDGFFHLATWFLTVAGVVLMWRAQSGARRETRGMIPFAATLSGWGLFNLVEGLINHQLLGLHHVRPASPHWAVYDAAFLASGVILIVVGEALMRHATKLAAPVASSGSDTGRRLD